MVGHSYFEFRCHSKAWRSTRSKERSKEGTTAQGGENRFKLQSSQRKRLLGYQQLDLPEKKRLKLYPEGDEQLLYERYPLFHFATELCLKRPDRYLKGWSRGTSSTKTANQDKLYLKINRTTAIEPPSPGNPRNNSAKHTQNGFLSTRQWPKVI